METLPDVVFTSPEKWDPTVLEYGTTPELLENLDTQADDSLLQDPMFDKFDESNQRVVLTMKRLLDLDPEGS